jgi:hypothetical protein
VVIFGSLTSGHTVSCGCHRDAILSGANRTHGKTGTAEHGGWKAMIARCTNPKNRRYHRYGGRGITVCERWRNSFEAFLEDMGPKPSPRHTVDRYPDRDGNYEPGNTRWATPKQQSRNQEKSLFYTHDGQTRSLPEWCEILGIDYQLVYNRLHVSGYSFDKAISSPKYSRV